MTPNRAWPTRPEAGASSGVACSRGRALAVATRRPSGWRTARSASGGGRAWCGTRVAGDRLPACAPAFPPTAGCADADRRVAAGSENGPDVDSGVGMYATGWGDDPFAGPDAKPKRYSEWGGRQKHATISRPPWPESNNLPSGIPGYASESRRVAPVTKKKLKVAYLCQWPGYAEDDFILRLLGLLHGPGIECVHPRRCDLLIIGPFRQRLRGASGTPTGSFTGIGRKT